jgi:hypothetical protein
MKTHWKKKFNYKYMGTYSLPDEKDIVVTIRTTDTQPVTNANGNIEDCLVVYFEEFDKPMILNRTNSNIIEKLAATAYIEDWPGTRIQIYVAKGIKAYNTITDGLRVRDFPPKPVDLDTAPAIEAVNACTDIDALLKLYFSLSKDLRADDEVIHAKNLRKEQLTQSQPIPPKAKPKNKKVTLKPQKPMKPMKPETLKT